MLTDYLHQSADLARKEELGSFEKNANATEIFRLSRQSLGDRLFTAGKSLAARPAKYIRRGVYLGAEQVRPRLLFKRQDRHDFRVDGSGDGNKGIIRLPIDMDFSELIEITNVYTLVDVMARLGGLLCACKWLFAIVGPLIVLHFLHRLALVIQEKYRRAYRDGLHEIAHKTFTQLVKIKSLAARSPEEWKFVGSEELALIDQFLKHCQRSGKQGEEMYRNEILYSNDQLLGHIELMIHFIKEVQVAAKQINITLNIDLEKLNQHKEIEAI
jgi:hypothetical protein